MIRRRLYYFSLDILERVSGRRYDLHWKLIDALTGRDSKRVSRKFLRFFVERGSLKPNDRVLDVGCGTGRMASELSEYLDREGRYEGFDIMPEAIESCRRNIGSKHPNFNFSLIDVSNKFYNPDGEEVASEMTFPWESNSFDFVFLRSVFTHLLPREMKNYLREIARVLRPDGTCLATFFLVNDVSLEFMRAGKSLVNFKYKGPHYRLLDPNVPERAIAYDEKLIRNLYARIGLEIVEPIHYGSWRGNWDQWPVQDVVVGTRKGDPREKVESAKSVRMTSSATSATV